MLIINNEMWEKEKDGGEFGGECVNNWKCERYKSNIINIMWLSKC